MKVADLMTRGVLSLAPDDPVRKAAQLMLRFGVNGFPVLDHGKLVGIITQGDFLRRAETSTERQHSRLAAFFADPGRLADIMTRDVVTVSPDAPLSDAVELMEKHNVKRLPVVGENGIMGMISRGDLLHAFLVATSKEPAEPLDDSAIASQLTVELKQQPWVPSGSIEFSVKDGVVVLSGTIRDPRQRNALRIAAENVPGVKR